MTDLNKPKMVLIHGWGLNSAIWQPLVSRLDKEFECICLDMPGYGTLAHQDGPNSLEELASALLADAPEEAHWCAWSLGGMAALMAAKTQPERFKSLNLLCTTPRFVQDSDWDIGMDINVFKTFAEQLAADYQSGIQKFLRMQAGVGARARALTSEAAALLKQYPAPTPETLSAGLEILNDADLRQGLSSMQVRSQVISGRRDRIVHPHAGEELSKSLPNAVYQRLNTGHAPHLSSPDKLARLLINHSKTGLATH